MLDAARADRNPPADIQSAIPDYLEQHYWWAYLRPASLRIFDRAPVVSAILWGQYRRLSDSVLTHIAPGDRVLQLACVYGNLSERIAGRVGPSGGLDIVDIAPIQIAHVRGKLTPFNWVRAIVANAATVRSERYRSVACFFLLHELPDPVKCAVVDAALAAVEPGGRAIFVDYAAPARLHPMRPVMAGVFAMLEPFATAMWRTEISQLASHPRDFAWTRSSHFGGLYQVVVAERALAKRRSVAPNANASHLSGQSGPVRLSRPATEIV